MKLAEALELVHRPHTEGGTRLRVALACSFTPLHLETYLIAYLRRHFPGSRVEVEPGLFGDLQGNLDRAAASEIDAAALVVEWEDVDPRMGLRGLGGWRPSDADDLATTASQRIDQLERGLKRLATLVPVACCLPTLPLPPAFSQHPYESGPTELTLLRLIAEFAEALSNEPRIRIVSAHALDQRSPPGERLDLSATMGTGFPYRLPHTRELAKALGLLIADPMPKKGLITDLDDTLWSGLLGEVGVDGLSWTLEDGTQEHGLYQQMLASLASSGVLIGVASKNEPRLVGRAFERDDLILRSDAVFPVEASWEPKSAAVARILETWNIDADAVVFVDDSPLELAEVSAAFPGLECLRFPTNNTNELWDFLVTLRERFGKHFVGEEDALRLPSIRSGVHMRLDSEIDPTVFLRSVEGLVTFSCSSELDSRALDLINKTNQFNLNGRRLTESEMRRYLSDPNAFLLSVSYRDRFGPLGKIAAVLGRRNGLCTAIDWWVMSCRAFSRRIEHHTLKFLFDKLKIDVVVVDHVPTTRNSALQDFLATISCCAESTITREVFLARMPPLVHDVTDASPEDSRG